MAQPPSGGPPHRPSGEQGGVPAEPPRPDQTPRSPQGFHPPAAPSASAGGAQSPPPAQGPPAPTQNRGCAVAAVASLAVVAVLLMAGGVWAIVWLSGSDGEYQAAPDCEVGQTTALDTLVSDYQTDIDQPIEGLSEDWREGHECRWVTPDDGTEVPSAARMAVVHHADHSEGEGADEAANALTAASDGASPTTIDDLGDTALSWNEPQSGFDWGCVGVQMSNLFVMSCYTAAVDFQASESIPAQEAAVGAEELARETVQSIEDGDF